LMALYCRIKGVENSLMGAFNFSDHYSFTCQPSAISFQLSAVSYRLSALQWYCLHCLLPFARCLPPTAYCLLLLHSPPMS